MKLEREKKSKTKKIEEEKTHNISKNYSNIMQEVPRSKEYYKRPAY